MSDTGPKFKIGDRVRPIVDVRPPARAAEFFELYGQTMSAWAAIEGALCDVFCALIPGGESHLLATAFYAVENFRSKLQMIDNVARATLAKKLMESWSSIHNKVSRKSKIRNTLAHYMIVQDHTGPVSSEMKLMPSVYGAGFRSPGYIYDEKKFTYDERRLRDVLESFSSTVERVREFSDRVRPQGPRL